MSKPAPRTARFYLIPGGPRVTVPIRQRRRRGRLAISLAIAALTAAAVLLVLAGPTRAATSQPCSLTVPRVQQQLDGSGTRTGHVRVECPFRFSTVNRIELEAAYQPGQLLAFRWHVLGIEAHGPYPARTPIVEPVDRDPYTGCGDWREVVLVRHAGETVQIGTSAESTFCG